MSKRIAPALLALGLWNAPAFATEHEVDSYGHVLESCWRAAEEPGAMRECVGRMAEVCMTTGEGGQTTLGMSLCHHAEAEVWDRFLNEEYAKTMDYFRGMDADEAESFPEFAHRVDALRDAQRAWIAFRDAECRLAYAEWGAGSMRHIAGTTCIMETTAERTIRLWTLRETY